MNNITLKFHSNQKIINIRLKDTHIIINLSKRKRRGITITINKSDYISLNNSEYVSTSETETLSINKSDQVSINQSDQVSLNEREEVLINNPNEVSTNESDHVLTNESERILTHESVYVSRPESEQILTNNLINESTNVNNINELKRKSYRALRILQTEMYLNGLQLCIDNLHMPESAICEIGKNLGEINYDLISHAL